MLMSRRRMVAVLAGILAIGGALLGGTHSNGAAVGAGSNAGLSAGASRTWVSGVGDDANPCSRTAPCKTFAGSISKTAQFGEIDTLDPGGFGALTITQSITIDGIGGGKSSVLVAGTNGLVVAAGAGDVVTLRNLQIQGLGAGSPQGLNGIQFTSGKALILENVTIEGFAQNGVEVALSNTGSSVTINDSRIHNNGGIAVHIATSVGSVSASINRTEISANQNGALVGDGASVNLDNSQISQNAGIGAGCFTSGTLACSMFTSHDDFDHNGGAAVSASRSAGSSTILVSLSDDDIVQNAMGINNPGPSATQKVDTFGNNRFEGNAVDGFWSNARSPQASVH